MTRFARAKGSKASNEREPEEATPWSVMVRGIRNKSTKKRDDVEDLEGDVDASAGGDDDEEVGDYVEEGTVVEAGKTSAGIDDGEASSSSKKKKRPPRPKDKCLNCKEKGHLKMDCPQLSEERRKELRELLVMKIERKGKGTGRKKNKGKQDEQAVATKTASTTTKKGQKQRPPPPAIKKEVKDKTGQVVQEGEGLFQGFRVRLQDVKRLQKLQRELTSQKTGSEEIKEILKRERRKAEKELAKFRKMVCYHCRQPGHLLSECPTAKASAVGSDSSSATPATAAKSTASSSGQCFKCGSSEHISRDCASKRKGEDAYKFAVCFICQESGHLAKSCPDNPKGLYPKGGGCRFCGSVEHLKSDCRRKTEKDARDEVRADRMDEDAERGLEEEPERKRAKKVKKSQGAKKGKVVSF